MVSWWQKTLLASVGIAGLIGGTYYVMTRRPLPKKNDVCRLEGLHQPVDIIVDHYGIPHIYAQTEDDLYFAQGYMHARDRLWQMELNRRIGSGRLSEIFGPIALETDRFCRRVGMHRASAQAENELPQKNRQLLGAYVQGVNAWINQNKRKLPLEFTLLRFKPEPWRIADTIQWTKMMSWGLGGNWEVEITRARLVAKLGADRASLLEAGYDPQHPLIVPPGTTYGGINAGMLEQYEMIKELSGFGPMGGSNNWVVDGTMTTTGAPILCNDPHLGQAAPSIWYECHLVAGDTDVIGASFPGTPGVVIGHNQHIAWGVTNAVSDVQDLYIEKFHPNNRYQYEYQGEWKEAEVVREEIRVKGRSEPIIEEVLITHHGPIITNLSSTQPGSSEQQTQQELPLALQWTGLKLGNIISSVYTLNRATNWEEFRNALRDWDTAPQNFVYADTTGNIGYIMAGAIPIRRHGQSLLPLPGWTDEYEWTGYIPFEELPQTYNPEQHYIVTANNRVVDDTYPYYISHEWLNGYRAQRIRDLLTSKEKLTMDDMATIQADYFSLPATEVIPHIITLQGTTPLEIAALDILRTWDFNLTPESVGAALYETLLHKLEQIVLGALLGDDEDLLRSYRGVGTTLLAVSNGYASRSKPLLIRLLNTKDDNWFANSVIPNGPTTWTTALERAFSAAIAELKDQLGSDILQWQYGKLHKMTYSHPLSMMKPLDRLFNRGPFPVGGDIDTVNMGATLPTKPEEVITVPSYRQIVNLADMSTSLSGHAPGQSGHPTSKHYDDLIPLWREVRHHPMLFTRHQIEANTEGVLQLLPEDF